MLILLLSYYAPILLFHLSELNIYIPREEWKFFALFERFNFRIFGIDKQNILAIIGIENTANKTLMQTEKGITKEQLKRKNASETPEFRPTILNCRT
ncbi:hypothetical protein [Aliivibrio fischeri]|uniref:hypothetical protein n=1 Tax=Aliivibrio fischeri TaxID=668 RepID=UPI001BE3E2B3|nr:hypothetical protein [Aliivibrio fischeri]USR97095.1 hypothetical protein AVFI_18085 [Aliivibrio fischeri ATCC 7744 = JCM 18803 = DSM 507]